MTGRVFFYVQHLMGVGHVFRATRIVKALVAQGIDITLVFGGEPIPGIATHGANMHQLPPVRAGEEVFNKLVDPDGNPVSEDYKNRRRELLLEIFRKSEPDIVITEAFPFGRRQMRFELIPLMDEARARAKPPLIVSSVRDIVQENAKPERDRETVDLVDKYFDHVLVHGDPGFVKFGDSFPLASEIANKLIHTGIVAPESLGPPRDSDRFDVIVSVGGGALGHKLLVAAAKAKPLCSLKNARWCIVTGIRHSAEQRAELEAAISPDMTLRDFIPDLPAALSAAKLSISRAGYNTIADLFVAGCRAVVAPLSDGIETEQIQRAELLSKNNLVTVIPPGGETPETVAKAIDESMAGPVPDRSKIRLDGAGETARLLGEMIARRAAGG